MHLTLNRVQGVNFKLQGEVDFVITFRPKNYFDIIQALGRGTRDFLKSSIGVLVIDKEKDIDVDTEGILIIIKI